MNEGNMFNTFWAISAFHQLWTNYTFIWKPKEAIGKCVFTSSHLSNFLFSVFKSSAHHLTSTDLLHLRFLSVSSAHVNSSSLTFDIGLLLQSFLLSLVILLSHTQLPTFRSLFPFHRLNSNFICGWIHTQSFFLSAWMLSFLCYLLYQVPSVSFRHVGAYVSQESIFAVSFADLSGPSAVCAGLLHLILVRGHT